jgi:C-5 cytosine-specific DNA methylase
VGGVSGGPAGADADADVDARYYVEDFENGTLTSSEGRTDRRPLLTTYTGRPDGGMPESDKSPAIDARMKDGPRRNQGGTLIVADEEAAPLSHGSNPNSNAAGRRREDDVNLVVDEVAPTLKSRSASGGTGVGGRTSDVEQPLVVEEPSVFTGAGGEQAEAPPVMGGEGPHGRAGTRMDDALVAEPQTFDWQISGGGEDKSFRGKGRAWIEDKPGTARALTKNKTLAVYTKTHGAQDAEDDHEMWDEAGVVRPVTPLTSSMVTDVVVEGDQEAVAYKVAPESGGGADLVASETDVAPAIAATDGVKQTDRGVRVAGGAAVRRLTPGECEKLQGFPSGWTDLGGTSDGPRYAALGDAVTVNVPFWVVSRLVRKWRMDGQEAG